MRTFRKVTRRSFLFSVVGGGAAGALLTVSDDAAALQSGCSDSDPISSGGDPGGRGRNCANRPQTGCSDTDPSDPAGHGTHCGTNTSQIGRSERRYEVCWVDDPSRGDDDCNIQTYSEWKITYADGHVEYDTSEAMQRRAEMEQRGYSARWHRMIVDW